MGVLAPDIFLDPWFSSLSDKEKLLFCGLIAIEQCGCIENNPEFIRAKIFPKGNWQTTQNIERALQKFIQAGKLIPYEDGRYLYLANYLRHRGSGNHPKSRLPLPPWLKWEPYKENSRLGNLVEDRDKFPPVKWDNSSEGIKPEKNSKESLPLPGSSHSPSCGNPTPQSMPLQCNDTVPSLNEQCNDNDPTVFEQCKDTEPSCLQTGPHIPDGKSALNQDFPSERLQTRNDKFALREEQLSKEKLREESKEQTKNQNLSQNSPLKEKETKNQICSLAEKLSVRVKLPLGQEEEDPLPVKPPEAPPPAVQVYQEETGAFLSRELWNKIRSLVGQKPETLALWRQTIQDFPDPGNLPALLKEYLNAWTRSLSLLKEVA